MGLSRVSASSIGGGQTTLVGSYGSRLDGGSSGTYGDGVGSCHVEPRGFVPRSPCRRVLRAPGGMGVRLRRLGPPSPGSAAHARHDPDPRSTPRPAARAGRRPRSMMRAFLDGQASGGLVLMAAAALALVVANSPLAPGLLRGAAAPTSVRSASAHWINDGLMAVFFLVVGLEIKREVLDGQLSHLARPRPAGRGGARRHGGARARVPRLQRRRPRGLARLGDPVGHRHRLRAGRALARWARACRPRSRCS